MLHLRKSEPATLQVGFARESIVPNDSIGLPGFGNAGVRRSTEVRDIVYTTCIAFSEGAETVLIYSVDVVSIGGSDADLVRNLITQKTGVPADKIMICATHTHSGTNFTEQPYFDDIFIPAFVKAAEKALADLTPAQIYGAKTKTEQMNSCRHYYTNAGEYVGNGFAWRSPVYQTLERCAREPDEEMLVIKFVREGDKKDITLINWQCHPCNCSDNDTFISADFIADTRDYFERETDMLCVYFTGAAGDMIQGNKLPSIKLRYTYPEFGHLVAKTALSALDTMTKIEGNGIRTIQKHYKYAANRGSFERLKEAKKARAFAEQIDSFDSKEVNDYAKSLGFSCLKEASVIVANAKKPKTLTMELNALYINGLAFVAAPYEMFAENGMFIKANSPFEFTVINELSNDYFHYFPVREAYEAKGIYEAFTADFAIGVAEATADQFVSMLNTLR